MNSDTKFFVILTKKEDGHEHGGGNAHLQHTGDKPRAPMYRITQTHLIIRIVISRPIGQTAPAAEEPLKNRLRAA